MLKRLNIVSPLFLALVVVPTLLAALYYGLFASDVYISESRFVARSQSKGDVSPLGLVLSGGALSAGSEENSAVKEYLESRRALSDADSDKLVTKAYMSPAIFWLDRFGGWTGSSREKLYEYFLKKATVEQETTTQVMRLTVRAYTPKEAQAINARLLERSEALVNTLSTRARADSVAIAQQEVDEAKATARQAVAALSAYRQRRGVIDPEKEAAVRLQMISKLQDELIAARTQLTQIETFTPQASQLPYLRTRVRALQGEIDQQTAGVAGGQRSLSAAAARFQELQLDAELAGKQLAATLASLQEARAEARRKRAYVERIAEPSLPDYASEPRRWRGIIATLILGLLAWGVISTLIVGVREHRD